MPIVKDWLIVITLAEGVGFEPTEEFPPRRFSRPFHSTALAPIHSND